MGDKSRKDTKEKAAEHDENLLSDSDNSLPDFECETCSASFSNAAAYASHVRGKKHHKKLAEAKFKAKNQMATNENEDSEEDDVSDSDEMHCEVCDKYFTGYISYSAHIKGSVHAKNVKKEKLKKQLGLMPEVLDKNKEHDSDDDDVLQKPYAKCSTCQKEFSGPEPFKMHMKSSAHLKKVKHSQVLQKLKSENENEAKNSDEEEFYSKCDVCRKSFSGFVPYQIHIKSNVHKKNLQKKKVAEEIKEFCANDDFDAGFVCKECKKLFTNPLAFKCHLENNSHEKRKAKDALLKFLNDYPEIVFVTPLDQEDSEGENASDEFDKKYYLICKVCHASFSGPESAQDHVKSKNHISIKKEKKMLKLLKEQKENSSQKLENKDSKSVNNKSSAKEVSANDKPKSSGNGYVNNADDFEMI